jgi:antitoxin VapB
VDPLLPFQLIQSSLNSTPLVPDPENIWSSIPVDLYLWYIPSWEVAMGKTGTAKLFRNGRSQAVRLPQEFRFEGDRVRIRRIDKGVLLEPLIPDVATWFHEMDRFNQEQFMGKKRNQPVTPRREIFK